MVKKLNARQLEQYWEDGFAVIDGALPTSLLDKMLRLTDKIVEDAKGLTESNECYDLEETHSPHKPRVRRLKSPFKYWALFDEFLRSDVALNPVEQIIGPNIRLYNNKMNMKAPGYGAAVEWHSDWAFYPHTNDSGLALGVYLDDVDEDNGPMMVIPGSHKAGVIDHHSEGYFCGAIDPIKTPMAFSQAVPLTGAAGTITLHHVRSVHGSALNRSTKPRRLLLQGYFSADAWPLNGFRNGQSIDDFDALIVRGVSTLEPRLANIPVKMPIPKALHQGSIYENQQTLKNRYFESMGPDKRATRSS